MIHLPNNCRRGEFSVYPKNWDKPGANLKAKWKFSYWFYDDNLKQRKKIVHKGFNKHDSLKGKQAAFKALMDDVTNKLLNKGANPIDKTFLDTSPPPPTSDISPQTPFIPAIRLSFEKLKTGKQTIDNIRSALTYIEKSADSLGYSKMEVRTISRKHISLLLENCAKIKERWSAHSHNHYRAYIMMLFKKLVELEAVENNPVNSNLPKQDVEFNFRELLTNEEIHKIGNHFKNDKYFSRFLEIFFRSTARPIELLRLKDTDVYPDFKDFKIKVRKRKKIVEEKKEIKIKAEKYWREIMKEIKQAGETDVFLFGSKSLAPGKKPATRDYVTKKWNREVKGKLGIQKDLYSIKHLSLEETAKILDAKAAAKQAGHKSDATTRKHYLPGEEERQRGLLRDIDIPFFKRKIK